MNTPNTLVERGASGEFSAGPVTLSTLRVGTTLVASGANSAVFGVSSQATGANSFAAGDQALASGSKTLAFNGRATSTGAIALGAGAQATSDDAIAMGPSAITGGLAAITLGPSIANGSFAVAIGLQNSASGNYSIAIGKNARTANRSGSIVLGDGSAGFSSDSVYATANNQFVARGTGGIKFYTSVNLSSGVEVAPGGGSWSSISDRNRKELFAPVNGEDLLVRLRSVPVSTWNYQTQDRSIRHMGPTAQDFHAAFGLGESDLLINTVDIDGVSLAAAQALEIRTTELRAENDALRRENARLETRQAELERHQAELDARLERLEASLDPSPRP